MKKKCFESIPQALNFDIGKDTTDNDHCMEDAGRYIEKIYRLSMLFFLSNIHCSHFQSSRECMAT